ncbi:metallophosphoesterase family protein [Pandoraea pulmonicola]|uniref:Calcineurin-like phosphoesterase superfamily domain n=3 Tax=Pandoraea pulmonicola TaxID=93221 RepID=A0AAJ4Z904_PANPU|nr:metallophosphoesterase [Pandoraea pulmonicola]SUA88979.1 Calcineurin-like phosphoesterase superfamily domain [Pandoraea pulmonicola]
MSSTQLRLAVLSDLHYDRVTDTDPCRPITARNGVAGDPMHGLLQLVKQSSSGSPAELLSADYLLCAGDITNRASPDGFDEGWRQLKELQAALGAKHLLAVTGNHEVNSRASERDNQAGNSEQALDPLSVIQKQVDYPSTAFTNDGDRWIYWGRGYQIVEQPNALFLLINSSHFHPTTRPNEFERGRVGDVALQLLREELKARVSKGKSRAFVALMHHHPIPHQPLGLVEDRTNMYNGAQLMEALQETGVTWLVIHGHKHYARLIPSQGGMGSPMVFSAGSFGAFLDGDLALKMQQQFYIIEMDVLDQSLQPKARAHIRALSWTGSGWSYNNAQRGGLPDRCGFHVPNFDLEEAIDSVVNVFANEDIPYLRWEEVLGRVPILRHLQPADTRFLRGLMESKGLHSTWQDGDWLPTEVAR